jgi:hypothetical protein
MSKRYKDKGRIGGVFVPLLKETLASEAWRMMEPSSRLIYIALKARYGRSNSGTTGEYTFPCGRQRKKSASAQIRLCAGFTSSSTSASSS